MVCMYCGCALKSFAGARLVNVNGARQVACSDIDACNARKNEAERQKRNA